MPSAELKFTGRINRRIPRSEGDFNDPVLRENWLSRDGRLRKPIGHESVITGLTDIPRWSGRYSSVGSIQIHPKTFVYTEDGKIHVLDDVAGTSTIVKENLNTDAYPNHVLFKNADVSTMYLVDGKNLFAYDGNGSNVWNIINVDDADGNSIEPIDVIEHKDRLVLISNTNLYISKNLFPEVFDDANDSLNIIVGSGRGKNLALRKIEDRLYILNTEGVFILEGDVISALAITFEVSLIEERNIVAGRTAIRVEKAIVFLADDYELWSFDGSRSQMLSYELKLSDFVSKEIPNLEKAVAVYHDNYYKMSFVEVAGTQPNLEVWWDAFENKIDIVRGRHVSCYMKTDPTVEDEYIEMGQSDSNVIVRDNRGYDFNGTAIITKLRTRDITPTKGFNVRFTAFYFSFEPTGNRDIVIRYLLDGRLSNPSGSDAVWTENLRGEVVTLGMISITNQAQATGRVRPKIKYSRGESIAFEITENTQDMKADFIGMRIEYLAKYSSKGVLIGA